MDSIRIPDLLRVYAKHSDMRNAGATAITIVMMNGSLVPDLFRTCVGYSGALLGKASSSLAVRA